MKIPSLCSVSTLALALVFLPLVGFGGPQQQWLTTIAGTGTNDDAPAYRRVIIDASGNTYVAGRIDNGGTTGLDALVAKVDASGTVLWTTTYAGNATTMPTIQFTDVLVDASGNVYAVGTDERPGGGGYSELIAIKLTSTGAYSTDWPDAGDGVGVRRIGGDTTFYYGGHVVLDGTGIAFSAENLNQLLLIRLTSSGDFNTAWSGVNGERPGIRSYTSDGGVTFDNFIATDSSGNYYLAGTTIQPGSGEDFTLLKYNSSGVRQWVFTYSVNATTDTYDALEDLKVDGSGNCYLSGNSFNAANTIKGMAVIKVTSAGAKSWAARGTGGGFGHRVIFDGSGNVYVCGRDDGIAGSGMTIWKYTSAGAHSTTWANTGSGVGVRRVGSSNEPAIDMALSSGGDLYVTSANSAKLTTAKITASNGNIPWTDILTGLTEPSQPYALNIGSGGHLIVTGLERVMNFWIGNKAVLYNYHHASRLGWRKRSSKPGVPRPPMRAMSAMRSGSFARPICA